MGEECAGAKLNIELFDLIGGDSSGPKQFFNANCQGVTLAGGSSLTEACAGAGVVSGAIYIPGASAEALHAAQQAAVLIERYCVP